MRIKISILMIISWALLGTQITINAQETNNAYVDGRVYVKLKDEVNMKLPTYKKGDGQDRKSYPLIGEIMEDYGISEIFHPFPLLKNKTFVNTYEVVFQDHERAAKLIAELEQDARVEYVERIPYETIEHTPNDTYVGDQWYLSAIDLIDAWDLSKGSSEVVIAVVDDGVKITHEDLAPNLWVNPGEIPNNGIDDDGNGYVDDINGYDVADNDNNPTTPNSATASNFSHGTHVANICAGAANNGRGIASIGYNVKLMAVKCTKDNTSNSSMIQYGWPGVQYAIAAGADIINMSWGGTGYSATYENLVNEAVAQGIIIVSAAGNSNSQTPFYPAAYQNVIGVAATDASDKKASFTNYGTWVNVSAPGTTIRSAVATNNTAYAYKSGTSMATPIVAGVVGLMLAHNPTLTPTAVMQYLYSSSDNINSLNPAYNGKLGIGRINALAALEAALPDGCLIPYQLKTNNLTDETVNLTWNKINSSNGYEVRIRPTNGSWATFSTTNNGYTYNNLNPCQEYEYQVRSKCSNYPDSAYSPSHVFTSAPSGPQGYCVSSGGTADFEWISRVKLGPLDNQSGSDGGYASHVCNAVPLTAGQSYALTLKTGYASSAYTEHWRVWIDFNQNGSFETSENVFATNSPSTTGGTGTVSIPATIASGSTRMRVAMKWVGTGDVEPPTACQTFEYGEVEDYTIKVINGTGGGSNSVCDSPNNVNASNLQENSAKISWNSASSASTYTIEYKTISASNWQSTSTSGINKTLTALSSGTNYQYRVKTVCGSSSSTYSSTKTFSTASPAPTPCNVPSSVSASSITHNSVRLSLLSVAGATAYNFRCRKVGTSSWITENATGTYTNINNLQASSTYEYQASTRCGIDLSAYTSSRTFVTASAPVSCSTPSNLSTSSVTQTSAKLQWGSVSSASSYGIQYRKTGTSSWTTISSTSTYKYIYSLIAGSTYEFKVKANCSSGSSGYSSSKTFNTSSATVVCNSPNNLNTSSVTQTSAKLQWGSVSGVSSYGIQYRKTGTSSWTTISSTSTYKYVYSLSAGSTYEFKVKSNCSSGSSSYSSSKTFSTTTPSCSLASNLNTYSISASQATLSWGNVSGASGYKVRYKKTSSSSWLYKTSSNSSTLVSSLLACTTYEFQVQTTCSSNSSAYSSSKTFTTTCSTSPPPAPSSDYCTIKALNSNYEWIQSVKIGSINNNSGANGGYGNYTNLSTTLNGGQSYNITLTPAHKSTAYGEYWVIYIDLNGDGDFNDTGEKVYDAGGTNTSVVNATMSIPSSVTAGSTRMRVLMQYSKAAPACGTYNYGEAEDYSVTLVSGGGSTPPSSGPANYCAAQSTNSNYEWIQKVVFAGINNNSGTNNGYGDYTSKTANVNAGSNYTINLTPGFKSSAYNEYWKIWIDWNADGTFSSNEVAFDAGGVSKNAVTGNIKIPSSAVSGKTRMRVIMKYNGGMNVCGNYSYGEVEDYSVNISGGSSGGGGSTPVVTYCTAKSTNANYEWIQKVVFAGIYNNSGTNNGYGDYTNKTASVLAGSSYSISLTPGYKSSAYSEYWKVWIDWNKDGIFGTNEVAFDSGGTSKTVVTGNIYVPSSVSDGETRMRIAMKYNGAANACGDYSYGEIEDYTVLIGSGTQDVVTAQEVVEPEQDCDINIAFEYTVEGNSVTFLNYSDGSYDGFFWSFGDGEFSENMNPVHTYRSKGDYFFQVTLTNSSLGCSKTFEGFVYILEDEKMQLEEEEEIDAQQKSEDAENGLENDK